MVGAFNISVGRQRSLSSHFLPAGTVRRIFDSFPPSTKGELIVVCEASDIGSILLEQLMNLISCSRPQEERVKVYSATNSTGRNRKNSSLSS